ncbi:MAG TPA: DUF2905 domain-containing protein [Chloroflexi bacterium]|nr:DUF2905 domain-containing protein [Chloroflexota bacterium]
MASFGRWLMLLGGLLFVLGGLLVLLARWGVPLGRLPGDFVYQRGNFTCVVPLATSVLLSVLFTLLLNLLARWLK